ncbi:MAG: choice-of-anchor D domain-containing protein, partial [Tepidisphaeraceae bacterium]
MKTIDCMVRAALSVLTAVQSEIDELSARSGRGRCANRLGGKRFAALLVWLVAVSGIPGLCGLPVPTPQNLGTVALGSSSSPTAVTVRLPSGGTVNSIFVSTQGFSNLDFANTGGGTCSVSTIYTSGQTCTVSVTFSPTAPGLRLGAVTLFNNSGAVLGTGYLFGTGTGSLLRYNPGTQSVLYSALNQPQAMVVDAGNNIYAADTVNARVLKFLWDADTSSYGSPVTPILVGTGWSAPTGVAVDGAGNLFVTDMTLNDVVEFPWNGSEYGTQFNIPGTYTFAQDLTIDGAGNLYIITSAATITELPWNGNGYLDPVSIGSGLSGSQYSTDFVDSSGNIFVADYGAGTVVKETYISSGDYSQATLASFGSDSADGVSTDPAGDIYVAVWAEGPGGEVVMLPRTGAGATDYGDPVQLTSSTPLAGSNPVGPEAIYLDGIGNIYIEDFNNNLIEKWSVTNLPTLTFPTHTNVGSADAADNPQTVSFLNVGNASLTIAVPGSGLNPTLASGFSYAGSSTCPQLNADSDPYQLAAAASCTYAVNFIPTEEGINSGSLVLTDNYLGAVSATQSIGLSGTGNSEVTKLAFATPPPSSISVGGNAGSSILVDEEKVSSALDTNAYDLITLTVTGPDDYLRTYTTTADAGVATFNLSAVALG